MLAVWRATYMLQNDTGPWGVFSRLQAWYWSEPHMVGGIKDGLRCFYCLSVWVALPFSLMLLPYMATPWEVPVYVLGLAGGAVIINILHDKI